jgi:hypothetical protein
MGRAITLQGEIVMSKSSATGTTVEESLVTDSGFGSKDLKANASLYRTNKAIMDAASRYDNVEDAIAGLRQTWIAFEAQVETGAGYTPDRELGFGSDNAAVIAESILGRRQSVGATRKSLKDLGK